MSPLDYKSIDEKLFKLQECVKVVDELSKKGREIFEKDDVIRGALLFNIVISIEIIVDIGNHILAEIFDKPAKTYRDVIISLGKNGVIPEQFASENEKMSDFRNKIIHDYDTVDTDRVFDDTEKAPVIFKLFMKYFVEFFERQKESGSTI